MVEIDEKTLLDRATTVARNAYAPYSRLGVGAAILTEAGGSTLRATSRSGLAARLRRRQTSGPPPGPPRAARCLQPPRHRGPMVAVGALRQHGGFAPAPRAAWSSSTSTAGPAGSRCAPWSPPGLASRPAGPEPAAAGTPTSPTWAPPCPTPLGVLVRASTYAAMAATSWRRPAVMPAAVPTDRWARKKRSRPSSVTPATSRRCPRGSSSW